MSSTGRPSPRRRLIIHRLALAAYPVLWLVAASIQQILWIEALRPLALSLLGALLLWPILRGLAGDWLKAGILASSFLLLFFSYGLIYDLIKNDALGGVVLGRHRYLTLLWLGLLGGVVWLTWRTPAVRLGPSNSFLNAACVVAVALPLVSMARLGVLSSRAAFTSPGLAEAGALH